ncbi:MULTISPECIES: TolC family protein [unclassified Moraxella]|uniref:TolC family protein n=1 Tax=unclassified Moraxella TaxID=2685852 RepID=UPI003AF47CEB
MSAFAQDLPNIEPVNSQITQPIAISLDQTAVDQTAIDPTPNTNHNAPTMPSYLSLDEAQQYFLQVSPKVTADQLAIVSREKMATTTKNLNKPVVYVGASATHLHLDRDIDTTRLKDELANGVNDGLGNLPIPLPLPNPLPIDLGSVITNPIPDSYNLDVKSNHVGANITALWSVYNGGKTQAITDLLNQRTEESRADANLSLDEQYTSLTKRYFNTQMALMALYLRSDALNAIRQADHAAQRALDVGLIAKVERLEAKNALANAEYENSKAQNDAMLAMQALQSLLRSDHAVKPTTPLFINTKPLPPLAYFQDVARQHHPAFAKVTAKYQQAKALHDFSQSNYKPNVMVFGRQQLASDDQSFIAGVSANWKLWGGIDREASNQSSLAQMQQAEFSQIEMADNINLLVQKNWQALKNAQQNYLSLNNNIALASEMLRFRRLGFKEGVNTPLEVMQAEVNLEKAKTEQARAVNDYVQALADLMQSCGTPLAFNDYAQQADVRLASPFAKS